MCFPFTKMGMLCIYLLLLSRHIYNVYFYMQMDWTQILNGQRKNNKSNPVPVTSQTPEIKLHKKLQLRREEAWKNMSPGSNAIVKQNKERWNTLNGVRAAPFCLPMHYHQFISYSLHLFQLISCLYHFFIT